MAVSFQKRGNEGGDEPSAVNARAESWHGKGGRFRVARLGQVLVRIPGQRFFRF